MGRGVKAGLVIRSQEVELLGMRGRTVTSRVRVPIEGAEPEHLAAAIRKALAAAAISPKRMAVSLPTQEVLFRYFTIPVVPKAECDAVVQFEARKYIPFKTELLIWDYRAAPAPDGKRLEIIFAAVPREIFQHVHDALAAAGVPPLLIEPRSLSLARLLPGAKGASADDFTCLVDVETDAAHLAIVKQRMPYLTRDIELLPPAQPDAAGGEPAVVEPPAEAVDLRAQRLLSELSVSMDFFMREHPSTTISRILVFGDETVVAPWCPWLGDQLHRPVELGHGVLAGHVDRELPLSFASAVGLLQAEPAGAPIDFLRRSLVQTGGARAAAPGAAGALGQLKAAVREPRMAVGAATLAGLMLAGWIAGRMMLGAEERRLAQLSAAAPSSHWGLAQAKQAELDALRQKAGAQLELLKRIMNRRLRVAPKLDALVRALPQGVWLTGLDFTDSLTMNPRSESSFLLQGACYLGDARYELTTLQNFESNLKQNAQFAEGFAAIRLQKMNAQDDPQQRYAYHTFELTCQAGRSM